MKPFWRLLTASLAAWWNDNVPRLGASLAYYTLFSMAPVLVVAIAIAGLAFGADTVRGRVIVEVHQLVGEQGAGAVQLLLEGARNRQAGIVATVLGGLTFFIASTGAFLELQAALNDIWRVKPKSGASVRDFLVNRLMSFGLVVGVGFLLLVTLLVSTALSAVGEWIGAQLSMPVAASWTLDLLLSLAVVATLFALLFKTLPDVRLGWRDVWIGALVTAVLFGVGKYLIGLYIGQSGTASSYGAIGSVVVLLLWVYYTAQIVLLGAEFTRVYTEHTRVGDAAPESYAERSAEAPPAGEKGRVWG